MRNRLPFQKRGSFLLAFALLLTTALFTSPAVTFADTVSILEPATGWNANNTLNVRADVAGTTVSKVEVYYATGTNTYPTTPLASQNAISGRTDYFFSLNLGSQTDTTSGKIKVVSKNASNVVTASAEVTGLVKTNLSTALTGLKDGATILKDSSGNTIGTRFVLWSKNATKAQVWLFGSSDSGTKTPTKVVELIKQGSLVNDGYYWVADVKNDGTTVYGQGLHYGYRVWGANWPYNSEWRPGTENGFVADVDASGNRYNPNKLLVDPYARTLSKDPDLSNGIFRSGIGNRGLDSAGAAPKGIVYDPSSYAWGTDARLKKPMSETIFYEMHVRGFTQDASSGVANPGTYKGVTQKVSHLNDLGVTAIELLPVHEFSNDAPSIDGNNFWGYMTLNYFAPDRRYSSDKTALGPITDFKNMVKSLHTNGKEVILDVVYNHTGEGGILNNDPNQSVILSWRGIDNQVYYSLSSDKKSFKDNTGCGANFNVAHPKVTQHVIDSLRYWTDEMHVDGFRFDLASVLGNTMQVGGFYYDKNSTLLNRIYKEFPDSKLVAEPWAIDDNTYQIGNFPGSYDAGFANVWSEWLDKYRNTLRKTVRGDDGQIPDLATRIAGSSDMYGDDGRRPFNAVNFITAHDGFTLNDLVSYNNKVNNQAYPYGPSDGGTDDNMSWDSGGDETLRRTQIRNFATHLLLNAGTPMILGGDEMRRTQKGNNNTYNLDTIANYYNWNDRNTHATIYNFFKGVIKLRKDHPVFKRTAFFTGTDKDGDSIPDIQWHGTTYKSPDWSTTSHTLAWRLDGGTAETKAATADNDFYIIANHYWGQLTFQLPPNTPGKKWYRVLDTAAWAETALTSNIEAPGTEDQISDGTWTNTAAATFAGNSSYTYGAHPRTMVVFIEK
ncbi:glycogen debranching protein [Brevibacillus dissolubilis]|uniref:glycogen debranching protein n=1 Tax=Brevibacillus dissolubilis TaxID=1844116 RepID=UPI0011169F26|nr:isoamylase [Brevibacillus dissolubilis]